jgi:osmotically-inducible protein OsmY
MKTNEELQRDVRQAIKWEPLLKAMEIGVIAKEGVITLTGTVDSYRKKAEAEAAARSVAGVQAVVEEIEIRFDNSLFSKNDNEIAAEVLNAFRWHADVPGDLLKITVEKGWVSLQGEVQWNYQKEIAESAVVNLLGVTGVINHIKIKANKHDEVEKAAIEDAIDLNWSLSDRDIKVEVSENKVTLTGTVDSWYQKNEAARIAWKAPGVWSVDNQLKVEYEFELAG